MVNEKINNMFCEIQGKTYYSRHESCVIRFTKSYYLSKRSLPPSNNRLKLTAPSVHAFCISAGVEILGRVAKKRAPRPAA